VASEARVISPEAAWQRLAECLAALPARQVALADAAGRVLAEPLRATVDVPFADVSAMDGYALAGEVDAGTTVPVLGRVAAGESAAVSVPRGSAVRIMTGAAMPAGTDRVVPIEDTDGGREAMLVRTPPPTGAHVRRRAEIHRAGDPLLAAGHRLVPGALALLAANGVTQVAMHAAPRVALLVTGDEVVPPEETPGPGQLRDSHTAFLTAAAAAAGAKILHLGIANDDPTDIRERLGRGLDADLLLATGGVSRGELDFVEPVLAELGFRPLFDAVAIQPGKPVAAMMLERPQQPPLLALGLPGNPGSAMVCFWLFVRPVLRRLQGIDDSFWAGALTGKLTAAAPGAGKRDRFLPAALEARDGKLRVTPISPRGSHDLAAFAQGTGLLRIPAGSSPAQAGDRCSVLPLHAEWG
jgi:molybdopterin molybdotransferase